MKYPGVCGWFFFSKIKSFIMDLSSPKSELSCSSFFLFSFSKGSDFGGLLFGFFVGFFGLSSSEFSSSVMKSLTF